MVRKGGLTKVHRDRVTGQRRFTGKPKELKASGFLGFVSADTIEVSVLLTFVHALQHLRVYPMGYGLRFARLWPSLLEHSEPRTRQAQAPTVSSNVIITQSPHRFQLPQVLVTEPKFLLADESLFQDLWQDARMPEVIEYLRGAKSLELPPEWKDVFPKSL